MNRLAVSTICGLLAVSVYTIKKIIRNGMQYPQNYMKKQNENQIVARIIRRNNLPFVYIPENIRDWSINSDPEGLSLVLDFLFRNKSSPQTVGNLFSADNIRKYLQALGCAREEYGAADRILKKTEKSLNMFLLWTDYGSDPLSDGWLSGSTGGADTDFVVKAEEAGNRYMEKMQVCCYLEKLEEALDLFQFTL